MLKTGIALAILGAAVFPAIALLAALFGFGFVAMVATRVSTAVVIGGVVLLVVYAVTRRNADQVRG